MPEISTDKVCFVIVKARDGGANYIYALLTGYVPFEKLTPQQMQALVKLVTKHDENVVAAWADPPVKEVAGAMLYQTRNCGFCHQINGAGGKNAREDGR